MSNRKWNAGIVLLFFLFAGLLLQFLLSTLHIHGLVSTLTGGGARPPAERHIVLISQELDNPFWRAVEQGAREAASRHGWELEYTGPFRMNPAEQLKLLEKSITAKPDAVLLQGLNDPAYAKLIQKAAAQGIPVITVDADEPDSVRLAYVGTDNKAAGKQLGELVAQAAGPGTAAGIGILIGSEAENQRLRLEGFRSVIERNPELAIVDVRISNISRLQAARQAEDLLSSYPQLQYLVGFSALDGPGMLAAAERFPRHGLRLFAFDDLEETRTGILSCSIQSSIVQQPRQMGLDAVSLLADYFAGKPVPPQHFTGTTVLDYSIVSAGMGASCP